MERFTEKYKAYYESALKRLQELENKLELGYLLEPPCKIGDTVYCLIIPRAVSNREQVFQRIVNKIHYDGKKFEIECDRTDVIYISTGEALYFCGVWNEKVFATKEQAELKLKELREKKWQK